jgi:hypothetical protein
MKTEKQYKELIKQKVCPLKWQTCYPKEEGTRLKLIKLEQKKGISQQIPIKRIIREYLENLYFNKLENLEEMDKFLDLYDLS